jgi:hypothetical protein
VDGWVDVQPISVSLVTGKYSSQPAMVTPDQGLSRSVLTSSCSCIWGQTLAISSEYLTQVCDVFLTG